MARVCLNMIVRNETANLPRCLTALAPHVDAYVIADTGSKDGTQAMIRDLLGARGIPGTIVEFPFEDFAQARNRALDACLASPLPFDYVLFCDADMELKVEDPAWRAGLTADAYMVVQRHGISYWNIRLLRRACPARYRGVTHEFLEVDGTTENLATIWYEDHASGANRSVKFDRDIALLTRALGLETDKALIARYTFYLANSYYDTNRFAEARDLYLKRAGMGFWREEVYVSRLRAARCLAALGTPVAKAVKELAALQRDFPHRAEAAHDAARICREAASWDDAYRHARIASAVEPPEGALFLENHVYRFGADDELGVAAYRAGRYEESLVANLRLLLKPDLPADARPRITDNYNFAAAKLRLPPWAG